MSAPQLSYSYLDMIRHIHPFPARMAPELAIASLKGLRRKGILLDPMVGSGMVVRHASELGHHSIGYDTDPLAVLMTRVWTTPIDVELVTSLMSNVLDRVCSLPEEITLNWMDSDAETTQFVEFWFGDSQRVALRRLAFVLSTLEESVQVQADVLRVALSRIIITKSSGASLARDVSHSRPHKVAESSNFNVMRAFENSVRQIARLLSASPPPGNTRIVSGDARNMDGVGDEQVDAVLTSPPYLNAIDYLRGHRLSLVWLGYTIPYLRSIRSNNIGAERALDKTKENLQAIVESMGRVDQLPKRISGMIGRYAVDIYELMAEIRRVLKPKGKSILVVGNSCINSIFVRNSEAVIKAGSMVGLTLVNQIERDLPVQSRYLPMPKDTSSALGKRMRTETILTLEKV